MNRPVGAEILLDGKTEVLVYIRLVKVLLSSADFPRSCGFLTGVISGSFCELSEKTPNNTVQPRPPDSYDSEYNLYHSVNRLARC